MLTVDFIIIALLIAALVCFVLSFVVGPRDRLWLAAAVLAIIAVCLKVFA